MIDRSGQQLGNYRIIRLLGKGGFAEVYLGEHIFLKTQVAIKVLHTQLASSDMEDFLREARTIARLRHPNIIRVLEFGIEDKTPFLVMDYAPNGTLRQHHPKGSILNIATIVPYAKQIASALQYAHDEKLIHRDIKPENMLVGSQFEIVLSDFGIAMAAESSRYQNAQEVVGTVAYMAPEQIQGMPRPASDQYSLAVVVYEWLSGTRPFQGSFTELCTQHIYASPLPLRERMPTIAPDVERVVSRALAKDPHQRFMSIQAFANALEESYQLQQETFVKPRFSAQFITPPTPTTRSLPTPSVPLKQERNSSFPGISIGGPGDNVFIGQESELRTGPVGGAAEQAKGKVWRIGKKEIVPIVVGALLFASLLFLSNSFELNDFASTAFVTLAWIALLFFCNTFGSRVGLFIGGGGFLLDWAFSGIAQNQYILDSIFWRSELGFAVAGLIAGLALLITKGRYNNFQALATATGISIIAALISIYIAYFPHISVHDLSVIPSLVLLPVLLALYNAISSRRNRAFS
ncbi:MAG: serine/threonine protein kinase [Ktedonobacteraceae bacterium]